MFIRNIMLMLLLSPVAAFSTDLPDFPFIVAVGEAVREVPPDKAKITLTITAFEESSERATDLVSRASAEVMKLLPKYGLPLTSIESSDLKKNTVRSRDEDYNRLEIQGYSVSRDVTIELKDISVYSGLAEDLISLDNMTRISGRFDVENRDDIERGVLAEAIDDAKEKASFMALSSGSKLANVYAMSQGNNFSGFMAAFGAASYNYEVSGISYDHGGSGVTLFAPKTIAIAQSVNMVFRIK